MLYFLRKCNIGEVKVAKKNNGKRTRLKNKDLVLLKIMAEWHRVLDATPTANRIEFASRNFSRWQGGKYEHFLSLVNKVRRWWIYRKLKGSFAGVEPLPGLTAKIKKTRSSKRRKAWRRKRSGRSASGGLPV